MTAALITPLDDRVAIALCSWVYGKKRPQSQEFIWTMLTDVQRAAYREQAKAALDACHAKELTESLRALLEDTQHRDHDCGDSLDYCPVLSARALLAKLDGQP